MPAVICNQRINIKTRLGDIFVATKRLDIINSISERESKDLFVGQVGKILPALLEKKTGLPLCYIFKCNPKHKWSLEVPFLDIF